MNLQKQKKFDMKLYFLEFVTELSIFLIMSWVSFEIQSQKQSNQKL